jgi:hypothetical protein
MEIMVEIAKKNESNNNKVNEEKSSCSGNKSDNNGVRKIAIEAKKKKK